MEKVLTKIQTKRKLPNENKIKLLYIYKARYCRKKKRITFEVAGYHNIIVFFCRKLCTREHIFLRFCKNKKENLRKFKFLVVFSVLFLLDWLYSCTLLMLVTRK